ncbi:MAG: sigma-54 dependent transcriptional regulator [Proteobacteria bacterium]|nr:sigma-54 dependent transcriptional regulator [Pseudomonadota bacterium]MBU1737321.1 sigma-54 dependent transcriptional regulator [Pseudomonadota bacterium]
MACGSSVENLKSLFPELNSLLGVVPCAFLAQNPSVSEAVLALQDGFAHYVENPAADGVIKEVLARISNPGAGKTAAVGRAERGVASMTGESNRIREVFALIRKICDTDSTVLVYGESGTGKELIAQALHYESGRASRPFIPVNCGAIPGELLESELFGHEKGAFTHAIRTRIGRFEMADGGTVFLDEISEMSPMLQVKLLRVLQERMFERVGGTRTIQSDFRVIAATNKNLEEQVERGAFRQDLFYRLNVIPIEAPPLRERGGDIPLLIERFINRFNRAKKKKITGLDHEVLEIMMKYPWPGNVRELENVVERMVILASGDHLTREDLPVKFLEGGRRFETAASKGFEIPPAGFSLSEEVAAFEKKIISKALEQTDWVKNRAARLLNVNRTTLIEKMKRYEMGARPDPDENEE